MRDNYNFSKSIKNPYTRKLKKQITIRLESDTIDYFKQIMNLPNSTPLELINLFLSDCAQKRLKPAIKWSNSPSL